MVPKACTARGFCESELICHPNCHRGGPHRGPTFRHLQTLFFLARWLSSPHKGAQGGPSGARDVQMPLLGRPASPVPKCHVPRHQSFSTVWEVWGAWGRVPVSAMCPVLDLASISRFRTGPRERRRRREKPLKNVSCSVHSAIHLTAEPSDTPMVHLLATRQLFPFYDILGFRSPAKSNLYHLISRKKNPPSQSQSLGSQSQWAPFLSPAFPGWSWTRGQC